MCVAHSSIRLLMICIPDLSLRKLRDLFVSWSVTQAAQTHVAREECNVIYIT